MKYQVKAPGRINLIGEHTDYNEGFVLPAAIDLTLELCCEPRPDRFVTAQAEGFGPARHFNIDELKPITGEPDWIDYIKAVCWVFEKHRYRLPGANISIKSTIPIGSGLSSSAAIELAFARAITAAAGLEIPPVELALLCQEAENEYVGVRCGIMDQMAVALGRDNMALLIDCRSLEYSYIPLQLGEHSLLIIDSRVERSLGASAYNRRRDECEETVRLLSSILNKEFKALRDLNSESLEKAGPNLPEILYRRSRYVIEENNRVRESVAALRKGDFSFFGSLMQRSHAGLRDLFEVSSYELDLIVDTALSIRGVLGARMTGAGFGGCALALLEADLIPKVKSKIEAAFKEKGLEEPRFYPTVAVDGVSLVGLGS